jgi:hypothetical protein
MTRTDTGLYEVRMPGLGPVDGVAHAELSAGWGYLQATACQIAQTWRDGADQMVRVACFNPAGDAQNLPFVVIYVGASSGPTPMLAARYTGAGVENAGGSPVSVSRSSVGRYTLTSGGGFDGRGFARITPVGTTPARCRPAETAVTNASLRIRVECDAPSGAAVDTGWTISYTEQVGMHHDPSVPAAYLATTGDPANPRIEPERTWSSNGEMPTITHQPQVGVYRVYYQQLGKPQVYPADAVSVLPQPGMELLLPPPTGAHRGLLLWRRWPAGRRDLRARLPASTMSELARLACPPKMRALGVSSRFRWVAPCGCLRM